MVDLSGQLRCTIKPISTNHAFFQMFGQADRINSKAKADKVDTIIRVYGKR